MCSPICLRLMQPPKERPCYVCGKFGHIARSCPNALCFKCFRPGHQARQCPYGNNSAATPRCLVCGTDGAHNRSYRSPSGLYGSQEGIAPQHCTLAEWPAADIANVMCFVCGKRGHLSCDANREDAELDSLESEDEEQEEEEEEAEEANCEISCYMCGNRGHVGEMCPTRRPLPRQQQFRQSQQQQFRQSQQQELRPWQVRQFERMNTDAAVANHAFRQRLHPYQQHQRSQYAQMRDSHARIPMGGHNNNFQNKFGGGNKFRGRQG